MTTSILEPFREEFPRSHDATTFEPLDFSNLLTFDNALQPPASSPFNSFAPSPLASTHPSNFLSSPTLATDNLFSTISSIGSDPSTIFNSSSFTTTHHTNHVVEQQYQPDFKLFENNIQEILPETIQLTPTQEKPLEIDFSPTLSNQNSNSSSSTHNNFSRQSECTGESSSFTPSKEHSTPKINCITTDKSSKVLSPIDKVAERRRKNRESSSRCYYNRKRIIENLEKQISVEKAKLTDLYDRALELRHCNAKLKRDVVTKGLNLPVRSINITPNNDQNMSQLSGYLNFMKSSYYRTVV